MLTTTTTHRMAFESISQVLGRIRSYYEFRNPSDLESASLFADTALEHDQNYALAVYFKGVVLDLFGKAADAVVFFERVLNESPDEGLKVEATLNLGVAYYHQYRHEHLQQAEACFKEVIGRATQPEVRGLAQAYLAQTYAMWMRPSSSQLRSPPEQAAAIVAHVQSKYDACQLVLKDLKGTNPQEPRVLAFLKNADAISKMYLTDHVTTEVEERTATLKVAQELLGEAWRYLPDDWALCCNLGSLSLRLAIAARDANRSVDSESHFSNAERELKRVVSTLRPNYGFAIYELGILYRVWKKWDLAKQYFLRARDVPSKYRDVNDDRITQELQKVESHSNEYP